MSGRNYVYSTLPENIFRYFLPSNLLFVAWRKCYFIKPFRNGKRMPVSVFHWVIVKNFISWGQNVWLTNAKNKPSRSTVKTHLAKKLFYITLLYDINVAITIKLLCKGNGIFIVLCISDRISATVLRNDDVWKNPYDYPLTYVYVARRKIPRPASDINSFGSDTDNGSDKELCSTCRVWFFADNVQELCHSSAVVVGVAFTIRPNDISAPPFSILKDFCWWFPFLVQNLLHLF